MKEPKQMSVLELPLITEKWQEDDINKRMEHARRIYNQMLADRLKAYREMTKTKKWRELEEIIKEELTLANGSKKKSERLKQAYEEKKQILTENGFSEFGFKNEIKYYYTYYNKTISSQVAAGSIATPMWVAFSKMIYGNGKMVHFKKVGELNSLVSPRTGLYFRYEDGKYYTIFSNKNAKARTVKIPVKGPITEYDKKMLDDANIKQCRVVRRMQKSKYHYYVQLCIEKPAHRKITADGELLHKLGKGTVGIAIWRGTVCAVSKDKILLRDMIPGAEEFEEQRNALTRKMEEERRKHNPQNFNEDGTIKKGIINEYGKKEKLKWHFSYKYKTYKNQKRELERKEKERRKLLKNEIVYQIIEMGDEFIAMNTSFLTKKPKWDEENPLTNEEYKKKKERRKAIQEAAPAELINKLSAKLMQYNIELTKVDIPEVQYWYTHEIDGADETKYVENKVQIGKKTYLHTPYRAFLMQHYDTSKKCYKTDECMKDWKYFTKAYKDM